MEEYVSQNKQNYMGKNPDKSFGKRSKKFVFVLYFCYFLTLTSLSVCVCVCVWWWNVFPVFLNKMKKTSKRLLFWFFHWFFSKWTSWFEELELKKRTLFSQQVNNQQLDYSKFPMTIFLFEFSNNWCCFELCYKNFFMISQNFSNRNHLMSTAILCIIISDSVKTRDWKSWTPLPFCTQ